MTCPIAKAINEIYTRSGGSYEGGLEEFGGENSAKVGGVEYICDHALYYGMKTKIELARLAANGRLSAMKAAIAPSGTYEENYRQIMSQLNSPIIKQIEEIVRLIEICEDLIYAKMVYTARSSTGVIMPIANGPSASAANLSLPTLSLPAMDLLSPSTICAAVNAICSYAQRLNVNSLLSRVIRAQLTKFPEFTGTLDFAQMIPAVDGYSPQEYMASLTAAVDQLLIVVAYCEQVEKYYCAAVNHLSTVVAMVSEINASLQ